MSDTRENRDDGGNAGEGCLAQLGIYAAMLAFLYPLTFADYSKAETAFYYATLFGVVALVFGLLLRSWGRIGVGNYVLWVAAFLFLPLAVQLSNWAIYQPIKWQLCVAEPTSECVYQRVEYLEGNDSWRDFDSLWGTLSMLRAGDVAAGRIPDGEFFKRYPEKIARDLARFEQLALLEQYIKSPNTSFSDAYDASKVLLESWEHFDLGVSYLLGAYQETASSFELARVLDVLLDSEQNGNIEPVLDKVIALVDEDSVFSEPFWDDSQANLYSFGQPRGSTNGLWLKSSQRLVQIPNENSCSNRFSTAMAHAKDQAVTLARTTRYMAERGGADKAAAAIDSVSGGATRSLLYVVLIDALPDAQRAEAVQSYADYVFAGFDRSRLEDRAWILAAFADRALSAGRLDEASRAADALRAIEFRTRAVNDAWASMLVSMLSAGQTVEADDYASLTFAQQVAARACFTRQIAETSPAVALEELETVRRLVARIWAYAVMASIESDDMRSIVRACAISATVDGGCTQAINRLSAAVEVNSSEQLSNLVWNLAEGDESLDYLIQSVCHGLPEAGRRALDAAASSPSICAGVGAEPPREPYDFDSIYRLNTSQSCYLFPASFEDGCGSTSSDIGNNGFDTQSILSLADSCERVAVVEGVLDSPPATHARREERCLVLLARSDKITALLRDIESSRRAGVDIADQLAEVAYALAISEAPRDHVAESH